MNQLRINISLLLLMLVVMGNSNCEGSKSKKGQYQLVEKPPFRIIEAYSQDWIAGIQQGGSGTNLFITLTQLTDSIVVQELFYNGMMVKSQISPSIRNQYIGYFKNEVNTDIIMDEDPAKESQNTPPYIIPFQLDEQEAVVGYLQDGVKRYFKIIDIEKKPPIAYPSNNRKIDQ